MSGIFISQNETIKTSTLWFLYIIIPICLTVLILIILKIFSEKQEQRRSYARNFFKALKK